MTWYHQHRRALQAQTGSAWHARVLELAFWHATHAVLSPLPPRALPTRDVALVADAAFEAILNTTAPAPHWERWVLTDAGAGPETRERDRDRGNETRDADGDAPGAYDDETETRRWTERAGGRETKPRASFAKDEYADSYARGAAAAARDPAAPARLCPSPPASELAARCLGLASRHDPAAAAEKFARELAPRTEGEHQRAEAHAVIYGARYLRARATSTQACVWRGWRCANGGAARLEGALLRAVAGEVVHAPELCEGALGHVVYIHGERIELSLEAVL